MRRNVAAAVFDDCDQAEKAIHELREAGVPNDAISVVQLHKENEQDREGGEDRHVVDTGDTKASGAAKGAATGAIVGAIAGIGALLIPGIGPFIAGGALAEAIGAGGSAAVASGAVGAAAGGLTGALVDYGIDREHAEYYERRIREGGVLVAVDTSEDPATHGLTRGILRTAGGVSADARDDADTREQADALGETEA